MRIVEPGDVELWVGGSCDERETQATMRLTGPVHEVTAADGRTVSVAVAAAVRCSRRRSDRARISAVRIADRRYVALTPTPTLGAGQPGGRMPLPAQAGSSGGHHP